MQATATKFKPLVQAKGVEPKRPGDQILVTIPHYWGKGTTFPEARQKLREAGGRVKDTAWRIYSVHPDTSLDAMGYINSPADHEPIVIAECDPE